MRTTGERPPEESSTAAVFTLSGQLLVGVHHRSLGDDVTRHEVAITRIFDLDTTEHLANDDLQVLVGHVLTLSGVNAQDFVNDVTLRGLDTLQAHQVV